MTDKAQAASLRKTRFALRRAALHLPDGLPPILALTDPERTPDVLTFAKSLPKGAGLIYRHFGASDREQTAIALSKIAGRGRLSLLIGNDPKLALAVKAAGVHWSEANISRARRWQNRFEIMTCAVHSRAAIKKGAQAGISAGLLSAIFPSKSPSAAKPIGLMAFKQMAISNVLPLYALGGVNSENMGKVASFGGIAAIDGLKSAKNK